jgi:hypothetical protein
MMLVLMCGSDIGVSTSVQIMNKCFSQSIPIEQATAAEQQPSNSPATGKQHSSNG